MKLRKYWLCVLVLVFSVGPVLMGREMAREFKLSQSRVIELAKKDSEMLWQKSVERFAGTVSDYTGVLHKQERIKGELGKEQVVEFKFRERPYSIFMRWKKNHGRIDKLLYVEGQNKNRMLVHPAGLLGFIKSVEKDPRDKDVLKSTRKPCTEFGLLKVMQGFLKQYKLDEGKSKMTTKFVKEFERNHRKYILLEQTFANPEKGAAAKRVITYDVELMLPSQRQVYDSGGRLLYQYTYEGLEFNVGLKDEDFGAKFNGL